MMAYVEQITTADSVEMDWVSGAWGIYNVQLEDLSDGYVPKAQRAPSSSRSQECAGEKGIIITSIVTELAKTLQTRACPQVTFV